MEGMEDMLGRLRSAGTDMHVMSNYPAWFHDLEAQLHLSRWIPWTFVSCEGPMKGLRKPDAAAFAAVSHALQQGHDQALSLTLVDDRLPNVEAARKAGWQAVHFQGCRHLHEQLADLGIPLA